MQIIYLQYTRIFNPESVKQATANMSTTEPKPSPMASWAHADSVLQLLSLPEGGDKHSAMQFKLTNM